MIDSRSCTTVASGPAPNAGSRPNLDMAAGRAMATLVATEQASSRKTATTIARSVDPVAMASAGSDSAASRMRDQSTGQQLGAQDAADRYPDGHAPDHQRLGLGSHRVGHVDDAGQEEHEPHIGRKLLLEPPDDHRSALGW